jgi:hypothetical protein
MKFDTNSPRSYFPNTNFMTPYVLRTGFRGRYAYELSEGESFSGEPMYGVSLRLKSTGERVDGKLCKSMIEAEKFISELMEY